MKWLKVICFFIDHDWEWHRAATWEFTDRWLTCERCGYKVDFPREIQPERGDNG